MAAASIPDLPQDLWREVLLKLPVEDVVKFRRLSKFHRDLIHSLHFIPKHNEVSVIFRGDINYKSQGFDHGVDFSRTNSTHKLIQPLKGRDGKCKLVDSCMGIVCYEVPDMDCLILWNPLRKNLSRRISLEGRNGGYILVHDSVTDDIKVILISPGRGTAFDVYSSKMNSWIGGFSIEEFLVGHDGYIYPRLPVFVEGSNSIHWWFSGQLILAYNFSTQKFKKFWRPEKFKKEKYSGNISSISSLDGCLCLYDSSEREHYLDVWTMKEYGVSKSWTRLFRISHFINGCWELVPIVFINNGSQLVVLSSGNRKHRLFLFDVETASIHTTELKKQLDKPSGIYHWSNIDFLVFTPNLREP